MQITRRKALLGIASMPATAAAATAAAPIERDYAFAEILHEWSKLSTAEKRVALDTLKAVQS